MSNSLVCAAALTLLFVFGLSYLTTPERIPPRLLVVDDRPTEDSPPPPPPPVSLDDAQQSRINDKLTHPALPPADFSNYYYEPVEVQPFDKLASLSNVPEYRSDAPPAPFGHTWTSGKHSVEAEFDRIEGAFVVLKNRNGEEIRVAAVKLSEADLLRLATLVERRDLKELPLTVGREFRKLERQEKRAKTIEMRKRCRANNHNRGLLVTPPAFSRSVS